MKSAQHKESFDVLGEFYSHALPVRHFVSPWVDTIHPGQTLAAHPVPVSDFNSLGSLHLFSLDSLKAEREREKEEGGGGGVAERRDSLLLEDALASLPARPLASVCVYAVQYVCM